MGRVTVLVAAAHNHGQTPHHGRSSESLGEHPEHAHIAHLSKEEKDADLLILRDEAAHHALTQEEQAVLSELEEEEKDKHGIPLGHYMQYVKGEVDRETSCLELPMTIILLLSFSNLALLHLKQDKVFVVEEALRFDLEENANFAWSHNFGHKTIHDVNGIPDFWSWLHIGLLPLVVQHSWGYSEDLQDAYTSLNQSHPYSTADLPGYFNWPVDIDKDGKPSLPVHGVKIPVRDDFLHYNRIIGGIRLRQERADSGYNLCRFPLSVPEELWRPWLGKPCMPAVPGYEMTPEAGDAETFGEPARVEWLATARDSLQQLQHKVVDMEDGCQQLDRKGRPGACLCESCAEGEFAGPWLDERTQRVEIAIVSYNPEYGLLSLSTLTFFFSRSGMIHKFVHVQSSWGDLFAGHILDVASMVASDILWVSLMTYVFLNEVKEILKTVRSSKDKWWKAIRYEYLDHWNVVDWVSMGLAFFVVAMFAQMLLETFKVMPEFQRMAGLDLGALDNAEYAKINQNFFSMVESLCGVERMYRMSFCFYPVAIMLRLFKSFAAQGRLAVVTRTLHDASTDMIHFFIVFFSVYFCMAVNSVLIFGQDIEAYSDLERATFTCFRAMFGEWDWGEMDEGTLWISAVWLWMFVMVLMVILLNFLLAILMDSYAIVKEASMNELDLMSQIDTMMRRRTQNKAKERVKLSYIFDTYFKDVGDEKQLLADKTFTTPEAVMAKVSGIPKSQAQRTMTGAKALFTPAEPDYTTQHVKDDLDWVDDRTQTIRDFVAAMKGLVLKYDSKSLFDHKTTSLHLEKPVPPRRQIVDAVRGEIDQLGNSISGVLQDEIEVFTEQHRDLETQNRNMLAQMQDTHRVMASVRAQTEAIRRDTQRQAIVERRAHAMEKFRGGRSQGFSIAACIAPAKVAKEAAPHRPH